MKRLILVIAIITATLAGGVLIYGQPPPSTWVPSYAGIISLLGYTPAAAPLSSTANEIAVFTGTDGKTLGASTCTADASGNLICPGKVGVGTTSPGSTLTVQAPLPTIETWESVQAADSRSFQIVGNSGFLFFRASNDAHNAFKDALGISRNGGLQVGDGYVATYNTPANGMIIQGKVGIGTASPTNILSLGGQAAQTIWMERETTAATAGNTLTLQSGGATAGATDTAGGNLILSSGTSTGAGTSSVLIKTFPAGGSGTADNAPTTALTISGSGAVTAAGTLAAGAGASTNHAVCWKAGGVLGYCSTIVDTSGACTCN